MYRHPASAQVPGTAGWTPRRPRRPASRLLSAPRSCSCLQTVSEVSDGFLQAVLEVDLGLPVERGLGKADVRLPLLRVIRRQRTMHDLGLATNETHDGFGELEHGELARVTDVDRAGEVGSRVHQAQHAFDEVVDIAEATGLHAIAVDGDRLALE